MSTCISPVLEERALAEAWDQAMEQANTPRLI